MFDTLTRVSRVLVAGFIAALFIGVPTIFPVEAAPPVSYSTVSFDGTADVAVQLFCPTYADELSAGPFPMQVGFRLSSNGRASVSWDLYPPFPGTISFQGQGPGRPLHGDLMSIPFAGSGGTQGLHVAGWNMEYTAFRINGTVLVDVNARTFTIQGQGRFTTGPHREIGGEDVELKGCLITIESSGGPVTIE